MRTLLIDTCGDVGSLALADGEVIVATLDMPARSASATLLSSISSLLQRAGWSIPDLSGIGVVSGPGSFTGLRVGLACAKGLCEALNIPLAAVSRLRVLASAANVRTGFAVLNAGRGELYVLQANDGSESLRSLESFLAEATSARVVAAEEQLLSTLIGAHAEVHSINAASSLPVVLQRLRDGADDLATTDANYVRGEQQIYGRVGEGKAVAAS